MKAKKKPWQKIIFILLVISIVIVAGINIWPLKNKDFWDMNFSSSATLVVALVVSYYFTSKKQDELSRKEVYLKILEKMQNLVNDSTLYLIDTNTDISLVTMRKRELSNSFNIIKTYADRFGISEEVTFLEQKLQEYTEFFGNHQDDLEYLKNSSKDLQRPLTLMSDKLSEMMIKIFE